MKSELAHSVGSSFWQCWHHEVLPLLSDADAHAVAFEELEPVALDAIGEDNTILCHLGLQHELLPRCEDAEIQLSLADH